MKHPEVPVCLSIFADGRLIGQAVANRYRNILAAARYGSGRHGFMFMPPVGVSFEPRSISVRRSIDSTALAASAGRDNRAAVSRTR